MREKGGSTEGRKRRDSQRMKKQRRRGEEDGWKVKDKGLEKKKVRIK